jgi:uncharacterized protein YuzE
MDMRFNVRYSTGVRAAYIQVGGDHRVVARTLHPVGDDDNVLIDFDANGQVVGIELLSVDAPAVNLLDDQEEEAIRVPVRPLEDYL